MIRKEWKGGGGGEKAWHVVLRVISRDLRLHLFTYLLANWMWCVCCYGLDCNNKGESRLSEQTTRIRHGKLDVWRHGFDSLSKSDIQIEKPTPCGSVSVKKTKHIQGGQVRMKTAEKWMAIGSQWADPIISSAGDKVAEQVDDTDPWPLAGI